MSAPFFVFQFSLSGVPFLTISSAEILHIMLCWSKKDVEASWYHKISSTLQCIVHSQSTFQLESFKNSLIDPLGLTMEKTNWFLWPFYSFSTAGCSTWLRDRDSRASDWICLTPPPFPKWVTPELLLRWLLQLDHTAPEVTLLLCSAGMRSQLRRLDTFRVNDSETIKTSWNISGFYEGERSNTHFHPSMGRIKSNQIMYWKSRKHSVRTIDVLLPTHLLWRWDPSNPKIYKYL